MANPQPTLLAHLPGYDTSPDIYETPEPSTPSAGAGIGTDDTASTASTVTPRGKTSGEEDFSQTSPSTSDEDDDEEDDDDDYEGGEGEDGEMDSVVVRRRLHPSRARDRFAAGAGRVRTRGVDLSERVDGGRKGYRVRPAATARGVDSRRGDEGLEARIARLRVEVEECRVLASKQSDGGNQEDGKDGAAGEDVDGLSRLLGQLETERTRRPGILRASSEVPGTWPKGEESRDGEPRRGDDDEVPLGRVAEFDTRLAAMEQALGLSALEMEHSSTANTPALLPALTMLDQQMSVLNSNASLAGLDALATRVRNIRREADEASALDTKSPASANEDNGEDQGDKTTMSATTFTKEDTDKLHALYALLPTLNSLAPTVPALLSRLRSLRELHAGAAQAAGELDEVEKRQERMAADLQGWRDGLEKVEAAVREASEANGRNGKVVEGWVKEVEGRVRGLGR